MNGRAKECPRRQRPEVGDVLESVLRRLRRHWKRTVAQPQKAAETEEAAEALEMASVAAGVEALEAAEAVFRPPELPALDSAAAEMAEEAERTLYPNPLLRLCDPADNPFEPRHSGSGAFLPGQRARHRPGSNEARRSRNVGHIWCRPLKGLPYHSPGSEPSCRIAILRETPECTGLLELRIVCSPRH